MCRSCRCCVAAARVALAASPVKISMSRPPNALSASPPPSNDTKRMRLWSCPAARTSSAALTQSWLPSVPPAPNTTRPESALRQVEQRATGECHQRAGPSHEAPAHRVKRLRTNAAGQIAGAQRRSARAYGLQRLRCQATGQIKSAAGA